MTTIEHFDESATEKLEFHLS